MKTLVLLRHADVDDPPTPPPANWSPELNSRGRRRSEALADLLEGAGVATIIVSPVLRTHQTATPLAERLGLALQVTPTWSQTATEALSSESGDVVLVIGHSNTIPKIINSVGGPMSGTEILEGHEDLFIITIVTPGSASFLHLKYGR